MSAAPFLPPRDSVSCVDCGDWLSDERAAGGELRCRECATIADWPEAGATRPNATPALALYRGEPEPGDEMPSAEDLARTHWQQSVARVHTGHVGALHWHLPSVQAALGPVSRGDCVLVGARTGSGKTLTLNNAFDAWVTAADAWHVGLYIGTEQNPDVLKIKVACARAAVSVRLVLKPERWEVGAPERAAALDAVQVELRFMAHGDYAKRAIFADTRRVDVAELRRWVRGAKRKYGVTFFVVDHIDRMATGNGRNAAHDMNEMVVRAKDLCVEEDVQGFLASQVRRASDRVVQLTPPDLEDFAGSSGKEREADLAVALWRPMDPDATPELLKKVRAKLADPTAIQLRNVAGVKCLKHRVDDARLGATALLDVRGHRLLERDPRHQHRTGFRV